MNRLLFVVAMAFALTCTCVARTTDDSPASKEDIARYLQVIQSHDMMKKMAVAMSQGMRQLLHEQYLQHKAELPADYESTMTVMMDNMFEKMPWDEMMQAMAPVYQKHFTKRDVDALIAFYSSPTGEKLLRDMPTIMAESMQTTTPIMLKYIDTIKDTLLKQTDVMIAESKKKSRAKTSPAHN